MNDKSFVRFGSVKILTQGYWLLFGFRKVIIYQDVTAQVITAKSKIKLMHSMKPAIRQCHKIGMYRFILPYMPNLSVWI